MKLRSVSSSSSSRPSVLITLVVVASLLAGCSLSSPAGPTEAAIYAVLYGHVTAPLGRSSITLTGRVYSDSADALAFGSTNGYLGPIPAIVPDSTKNLNNQTIAYFNEYLRGANTAVIYLSVLAQGQGNAGIVYSTDTAFAIRMRVDSVGGTLGHDSAGVYLTLP
jgi:hypothetical protein